MFSLQLFDLALPEYITISEEIFPNSSTVISRLSITNVETGDVGQYLCLYSQYLHLGEQNLRAENGSNSLYLFVTGKKNESNVFNFHI